MKKEVIKRDNYVINYIKTKKFKSCHIQVLFKQKLDVKEVTVNSLLEDFLQYSSYDFPSRRELLIEYEYLYDAYVDGNLTRVGDNLFHKFDLDFLDPKYCDDDYLEEVIKLLSNVILKPNFNNGDYTNRCFEICKNNYRDYLTSMREKPMKYAFNKAIGIFGKNTSTGVALDGNLEDLEKTTVNDLKKAYDRMLNNTECYIYIVGNLNKKEVVSYLDKYFASIKKYSNNNTLFINNESREDSLYIEEIGPFKQDSLVIFYNLDLKSRKEKYVSSALFNFILGSGGLTSKLYDNVREKNSLCYTIFSNFSPNDNFLFIGAGINKKDKDLCLKLIDKCLNEMINGDFSEREIKDSIKAFENKLKNISSSIDSILAYNFDLDFRDRYEAKEFIEVMKSVKKEDIMKIARKAKKNVVFLLCGEDNNETN